jgi:hypothetical protein
LKRYRVKGVIHSRYTARGSRIRKKKRIGRRARLAVVISLTVLFSVIFAIIVGNLLNDKSRDADEYFDSVEPIEVNDSLMLGNSSPIRGVGVAIGDKIIDKEGRYSAATFFVNGESGVLYSSSVADHFGREHDPELSLGDYVLGLSDAGYASVACFRSGFLSIENAAARDAESLYEQGLIAEIASQGVSEVLVFFDEVSGENLGDIKEFLRLVKLRCPNTAIGVRAEISDIMSTDVWSQISGLCACCDYVALDISGVELSEDGGEDARFLASMRFYLLNYNVRILFDSENVTVESFIDKMKITNWSTIISEVK